MTVSLLDLWIPILAGSVLLWFASSLIHMILKYHNSDYQKLSNEDEVGAAINKGSNPPGFYSFPHCLDMKEMQDESIQKKFNNGPVGMLAIMPNGMPPMGKLIGIQYIYFLFTALLVAYCSTLALVPSSDYMVVFRFVTSVAFLAFGWAVIPFSIWYGHPWSTSMKYLLDALIYAVILGGMFGWLWPSII